MKHSNYKTSRDLFEFASSLDTDEIYESAGKPYPARALANAITPVILTLGRKSGKIDDSLVFDTSSDGSPALLLWRGIDDTQRVLVPRLEQQQSYKSAADYIRHEKTIHSLALLALRHYESMNSLIDELTIGKYRPIEPSPYFELPRFESTSSTSRGCPAAKPAAPDMIKPVWKDFAVWIGEISLKGIVHHRNAVKPAFFHERAQEVS